MNIAIVNYGLGNIASIINAFRKIEVSVTLSANVNELREADALVLPGVGAFPEAMKNLRKNRLDNVLIELVQKKKIPILGICLGMQILADFGEEISPCEGLGLIPGRVRKLSNKKQRKVPFVGWSKVKILEPGKSIFCRSNIEDTFYFDHSFYFDAAKECRAATVAFDEDIVAAVTRGKVWGFQFHPEKSQNSGLRLLKAFCLMVDRESCQ
jgi:glutamine amidotransferase